MVTGYLKIVLWCLEYDKVRDPINMFVQTKIEFLKKVNCSLSNRLHFAHIRKIWKRNVKKVNGLKVIAKWIYIEYREKWQKHGSDMINLTKKQFVKKQHFSTFEVRASIFKLGLDNIVGQTKFAYWNCIIKNKEVLFFLRIYYFFHLFWRCTILCPIKRIFLHICIFPAYKFLI